MTSSPSLPVTEASIRATLSGVYDPEFGVSVEAMGLIYEVVVTADHALILMTLTSQYCPAGDMMVDGVRAAVAAIPGLATVDMQLVWDPVWRPDFLNAAARQQLGFNPA